MKIIKIFSVVMIIVTVTYVSYEAHAYSNSNEGYSDCGWIKPGAGLDWFAIAYSATLYEGETSPPVWYSPEELGAVAILDYGEENASNVWLCVPPGNEPFPLREVKPIFIYPGKNNFYQVSELCISFPVPRNLPQQPAGAIFCGVGWIATGMLYLKWKGEDEEVKSG
ncbi:hypothetical protein KEJ15_02200 [Candidatus Bathyarchaeota archaeon]|nr:hypothetical protein [Candidatus Bathyarchaeota archaeon]